jgi:DsbC/DsbD-like thiol-disulfide interchange protein
MGIEIGISQAIEMVSLEIPQEVRISIGETEEISIDVTIKEGYHVQANPVNDDFLIPTAIETKSSKEIVPGTPIYPPGKSFILKGTYDTLLVYDGMFSIKLPIRLLFNAHQGEYTIEGKLHYQACDSIRCFVPRSVLFTIPIKLVKK